MTDLSKLPKTKRKSQKRRGRGYGSGKGGHTTGRGAKGDKARGKVGLVFEGSKSKKSFIRRLPFRRGKGKFKSLKSKPIVINLEALNLLPKDSLVTIETLAKYRLVDQKEAALLGVKILGGGQLKIALTVKLPCSQGAAKKITKAGGKVEASQEKKKPPVSRAKKEPAAKKLKEDKKGKGRQS